MTVALVAPVAISAGMAKSSAPAFAPTKTRYRISEEGVTSSVAAFQLTRTALSPTAAADCAPLNVGGVVSATGPSAGPPGPGAPVRTHATIVSIDSSGIGFPPAGMWTPWMQVELGSILARR